MAERTYSDDEKASALAVLAANGGDVRETARMMGIPKATLRAWDEHGVPAHVADMSAEGMRSLAGAFADIAYQALRLVPGRMHEVSAPDLAAIASVATAKMLVLLEKAGPPPKSRSMYDWSRLTKEELTQVEALTMKARPTPPA